MKRLKIIFYHKDVSYYLSVMSIVRLSCLINAFADQSTISKIVLLEDGTSGIPGF